MDFHILKVSGLLVNINKVKVVIFRNEGKTAKRESVVEIPKVLEMSGAYIQVYIWDCN